MLNAKNGRVEIGGTYMDHASFGSGERTLVILPGLSVTKVTTAAAALAVMYRIFAKDFTVYLFDRKDDIPDGYSVYDMADDTAAAMKFLGIEKACVLGVSQGGMIAQAMAVKYPELVEKLVLGSTLSRQNETVRGVINKWTEYAGQGDFAALNKSSFELLYTEKYLKKNRLLLAAAVKTVKPDDPKKFITLAKACLTFDIYDELEKIKCPVLVLGAGHDKVVTGEASEEIAEKLNCGIYMYEDFGHAVYDEADDYRQRIYDFIK